MHRLRQVIRAVDHYLFDASVGGYRLNTNFNDVLLNMGRCFGFAFGHKENGAMFSHMAVMYAYALYMSGDMRMSGLSGFGIISTGKASNFPLVACIRASQSISTPGARYVSLPDRFSKLVSTDYADTSFWCAGPIR